MTYRDLIDQLRSHNVKTYGFRAAEHPQNMQPETSTERTASITLLYHGESGVVNVECVDGTALDVSGWPAEPVHIKTTRSGLEKLADWYGAFRKRLRTS